MDDKWSIIYYQSQNDKQPPVYIFIENLQIKAQAKVAHTLDLLEIYGIKLGLPHVKKLSGTDLWELRILGNDSIRILYIAVTGKTFLLLHGFVKKAQKTDQKEIRLALFRLKEHQSRTDK